MKNYVLFFGLLLCININADQWNYSCNGSNGRLPSWQPCCSTCSGCKFYYDGGRIRGRCNWCQRPPRWGTTNWSVHCDGANQKIDNDFDGGLVCR